MMTARPDCDNQSLPLHGFHTCHVGRSCHRAHPSQQPGHCPQSIAASSRHIHVMPQGHMQCCEQQSTCMHHCNPQQAHPSSLASAHRAQQPAAASMSCRKGRCNLVRIWPTHTIAVFLKIAVRLCIIHDTVLHARGGRCSAIALMRHQPSIHSVRCKHLL